MRKLVKSAQKPVLGLIAVLTVVWSSGLAFMAPKVAQAAPFSWPTFTNTVNIGGVPARDEEGRKSCTDNSNGGNNSISPSEVDIGSQADCQTPGITNPGPSASSFYVYEDVNGDTTDCTTSGDDWLYRRTRYAGNPLQVNASNGFTNNLWYDAFDLDGDAIEDFYLILNGNGDKTEETLALYRDISAYPAGAIWTITNPIDSGYTRVVATPENGSIGDATEYFIDTQVPISAFTDTNGDPAICSGTPLRFVSISTATQQNVQQKDNLLGTGASDPILGIDLAVTKTVDDATPTEGDTIVYTVTVVNNGPADATAVTVDDILPTGVTYVSDDSSGAYNAGTGVWTVGNLVDDASATINITATVDQGTAGSTITNTACSDYEEDAEPANDCDSVDIIPVDDVVVLDIDLEATKSVDNATPTEGTQVVYTISVTNNGPDDATGVVLNDVLPAGVTYVSDESEGTYNSATGVLTIGNLANGATFTTTITVSVDQGTATQTITNTLCSDMDQTDTDTSNDCDTADIIPVDEIFIPFADLEVSKVASDTTPVVGTNFVYTIAVHNAGPDSAFNATVNDLLPVGVTYVSDDGAGAYDSTTGVWTIGTIAADATVTLNITVSVDPGTAGTLISNTACADNSIPDPDQTDDCDTADITPDPVVIVDPQADDLDIAVTETVSDPTPNEGDTISFTINALNGGPVAATGLSLTVNLPAGVTFVSSSGVGSYNPTTKVWTIGNLGVGNSASLTISVTVDAGTGGQTLTSDAVLLAVDQNDTDSTNNDDDASITIPEVTDTQTPPPAEETLVETGFGSNVQIIAGLTLLAALAVFSFGYRRRTA
jgi:uncharacterized repeat protein (TIGR01451 family)